MFLKKTELDIESDCYSNNYAFGSWFITRLSEKFNHLFTFSLFTFQKKQLAFPSGRRASNFDPNNLTFKFDISLDVWEEDGKGSYQTVARDKSHFKLRKDLQRKLVFIIEQTSNREMKIER